MRSPGHLLGTAGALFALAVAALPLDVAHGSADRSQTNRVDGPVVVQADPFTTGATDLADGQIEMTTISTRPSLVTGDDVRVAVRGLADDDQLVVTRDGVDVSGAFKRAASRPGQAPGAAEGVVTGLRHGSNELRATARGARFGSRQVMLSVQSHSLQGPVISGPHQTPFVCQQDDVTLGPTSGPNCVAPARVAWYYADRAGQFHLLADPYSPYPPDTATTTVNGNQVPFVVRIEGVVINRSITQIGVLDDPFARGADQLFAPVQWNRRLVYQFGQGCGTGYYQGWNDNGYADLLGDVNSSTGANSVGALIGLTEWLGRGGMVAQSSLTTFRVSCNQVTSAETLMMVKEHIIDSYGDITHTIGAGTSGGAIQQYTNADGYPGLIDAGTLMLSFPDVWSLAMTAYACTTLERVFNADPIRWTDAKRVAITGMPSPQTCKDFATNPSSLNPYLCPPGIPATQIYHPQSNPQGVRCDLQDSMKSVLGTDPATGFAYRPIDDVGVQYGLKALHDGRITATDFLDLNREVGGLDLDVEFMPKRASMPPAVASRMYRTGLITGRGAIADTPIIDQSIPAMDYIPGLDIHEQVRPFQMRARLDAAVGTHASQAIWSAAPLPSNAIVVADQWLDELDALQVSQPSWSRTRLVVESRPLAAADQCRAGTVGSPMGCEEGMLRGSTPRQVAGAPFAEDNIDCRLRPAQAADHPAFTPAQFAQFAAIFSAGVCDHTEPPIGWSELSATWLSYGADGALLADPVDVPYPLVRSRIPGAGAPSSLRLARPAGGNLPATGSSVGWALTGLLALAGAGGLARFRRSTAAWARREV